MADQDKSAAPADAPKRKKTQNGLSPRDLRAIEYYLSDKTRSAPDAMRKAGFSEKTATFGSKRWLERPAVQEAIAKRSGSIQLKADLDSARILQELARLGLFNWADVMSTKEDGTSFVDISKFTAEHWAAVQSIEWEELKGLGPENPIIKTKIRIHSKTEVLKIIAQHFQMLTEHITVTHKYENMTPEERMSARMALTEKRAAIRAKLKEKGIDIPTKPNAPGSAAIQ